MSESLKIAWSDDLCSGDRATDVQHKYLIRVINELAEAIEAGTGAKAIREILNFLKYYTEWHFEREELCMHRKKCPAAEINKRAHQTFIQTFNDFSREYNESGGSEEIARRMYTTLVDWLVNHITKVDAQLERCAH